MNTRIRPATAQDANQLSRLAIRSKAYWPYDPSFIELCKSDLTITPERAEMGNIFVAQHEEQIVGFYSFSLHSNPPEMNNLFVLPELIGKGVGLQLWKHAIEFARSQDWRYFVMDADPYAAEKFYYKIGCYKIGEIESTALKGRFIPKLRFDVPVVEDACFSTIGVDSKVSLDFRALTRSDFPLLQKWFAEPHVKEWWHDDFDADEVEAKYGPRVDGTEPTHVYIILQNTKPIGLIQWYLWADYPDHAGQLGAENTAAGMDLAIGEKEHVGKGIGSVVIHEFIRKIIFNDSAATAVITDPEEQNSRSLRAFKKAGFLPLRTIQLRGESLRRLVVCLNVDRNKRA